MEASEAAVCEKHSILNLGKTCIGCSAHLLLELGLTRSRRDRSHCRRNCASADLEVRLAQVWIPHHWGARLTPCESRFLYWEVETPSPLETSVICLLLSAVSFLSERQHSSAGLLPSGSEPHMPFMLVEDSKTIIRIKFFNVCKCVNFKARRAFSQAYPHTVRRLPIQLGSAEQGRPLWTQLLQLIFTSWKTSFLLLLWT